MIRQAHLTLGSVVWVLELQDTASDEEAVVCVRVDQHIVVVLVPARCGRVLGNLANKAACEHVVLLLSGVRVEVPADDVHRRDLGFLAGLERLLHSVLARVGRRVVAQQRGDLAVARIDALRGRQVHARDHKVLVGRVGEARVVQEHLKRRVVQLGRAHLAQRVPVAKLHRALDEAHVHLGTGPHHLAVLSRLLRAHGGPVLALLRPYLQHGRKGLHLLVHGLLGPGHLLEQDHVKVGHDGREREPLLRQLGALVRALVLLLVGALARLDVRLVGAAEAHLARVEAADAQPVVRVHRDGRAGARLALGAGHLGRLGRLGRLGGRGRGGERNEGRGPLLAVPLGEGLLLRQLHTGLHVGIGRFGRKHLLDDLGRLGGRLRLVRSNDLGVGDLDLLLERHQLLDHHIAVRRDAADR